MIQRIAQVNLDYINSFGAQLDPSAGDLSTFYYINFRLYQPFFAGIS